MLIIADVPTAVTHPSWCSPHACDAGSHLDIKHSTAPQVWKATAADVEITLAVQRDDERTASGEFRPHATGVLLHLADTVSSWPDGSDMRAQVLLTVDDVEQLAASLLERAAQIRRDDSSTVTW